MVNRYAMSETGLVLLLQCYCRYFFIFTDPWEIMKNQPWYPKPCFGKGKLLEAMAMFSIYLKLQLVYILQSNTENDTYIY